jgi:conjugal transfer ATP-binding protein TraC
MLGDLWDGLHRRLGTLFGDGDFLDPGLNLSTAYPIAQVLPYRSWDELNQLFVNQNSIGFALELTPLIGATDDSVKLLAGLITDGIPPGWSVQVINWASPRIGDVLERWAAPRQQTGGIFEEIARRRSDYLGPGAYDSLLPSAPYLLRKFRVIFTVAAPRDQKLTSQDDMLACRQAVVGTLSSVQIKSQLMQPADLINFVAELLQQDGGLYPFTHEYRPLDPISAQITSGEQYIRHTPTGLSLGRQTCRAYTVAAYPDYFTQWQANRLCGDPDNEQLRMPTAFLTVFNMRIKEDSANAQLKLKSLRATQQAGTDLARWYPRAIQVAQELRFVSGKLDAGLKLAETFHAVCVFAPGNKIRAADQRIRDIYRANGMRLQAERYVQLQTFLGCLPFMGADSVADDLKRLGRTKTQVTWTAANLAPFQGEFRGMASPGMLLTGRRGQPFCWDPFDHTSGNYNVAVVGKSGAGKSVYMQELVNTQLSLGARVFVADDGRSFYNSILLQGGQVVEFSPGKRLCINPFSFIDPGYAAADQTYLTDALQFIALMVRRMVRTVGETTDFENALITEAVARAYQADGNSADITKVAEYLSGRDDPRATDLAQMLGAWVSGGLYGDYLNGPATIDLTSRLTGFELSEIKGLKDLQALVLMVIMYLVSEQMVRGGRRGRFLFLLDEAWDLLGGQKTQEFIEAFVRRCRKYGGSLVTGTQSITDYYKNPASQAALENSDWQCLLAQKPDSITRLVEDKRLHLDAHEERELRSIHTVGGQYAEVMIRGPDYYHIGRLILDPFSLALYSSKAEDFAQIQRLLATGLDLKDAISAVAERYARRGDTGLTVQSINEQLVALVKSGQTPREALQTLAAQAAASEQEVA